jgi:DNA repair protein RecO (recombination protein O)
MLTKDTAICIRAVDFSETSQVVTFFARASGKVSVIAKGSKRPKSAFDGPIEVLSYGKIVFADSNKEKLATLTEFQSAYGGPGLTNLPRDLFALNCGLFAAELVNHLTNDCDPHPELFDGFLQFLQAINEQRGVGDGRRDMLGLLIVFQLALLREVGLMPVFDSCVNCKTSHGSRATSDEFYFSSSANGLICRDCEVSFPDKIKLTKNAASCLANFQQIAKSQEKTLNEIEKVLVHHFTEILGRHPKMAKHILKC